MEKIPVVPVFPPPLARGGKLNFRLFKGRFQSLRRLTSWPQIDLRYLAGASALLFARFVAAASAEDSRASASASARITLRLPATVEVTQMPAMTTDNAGQQICLQRLPASRVSLTFEGEKSEARKEIHLTLDGTRQCVALPSQTASSDSRSILLISAE